MQYYNLSCRREIIEEIHMKSKIEYGDYLLLGANSLPEEYQVNFLDYLKYFVESGVTVLEEKFKEKFGIKSLPKRDVDQIIEGILACSPKDLEKKRKDKNYYLCNAICLLEMLKKIFDIDLYNVLKCPSTPSIARHNYEHILKWMLMDAEELCNLYSNIVLQDFTYRSYMDSRYIHYMSVHQVLRQSLYGQVSCNSFADMEISASIAIIRQLVELRVRRAFGVISYIEKDSWKLVPLDLSQVFDCLKKHKNDIDFPLKIENIERIYKWANMYIHSGKCELSWVPYYIDLVLKKFSFGDQSEKGWDVKNAILTSSTVIQRIHEELLIDKPNLEIYSCRLECAIQ